MSLKTKNLETFWMFLMTFEISNKKGYLGKNTQVGIGYLGFEVQGYLKILKGLYRISTVQVLSNAYDMQQCTILNFPQQTF